MKTALTIAGSDSSGGAGIQADLKVFTVLGVYGMSAITAVTAQNTLGVKEVLSIPEEIIAKQIDVTVGDIQADATKTGMIGNVLAVEAVADAIKRNNLQPYVCDPVMFAKSGDKLLDDDAIERVKRKLFPLATVITPNRREAAGLASGLKLVDSIDQAKQLVNMAVQYSDGQGRGTSPVNVMAFKPKKK